MDLQSIYLFSTSISVSLGHREIVQTVNPVEVCLWSSELCVLQRGKDYRRNLNLQQPTAEKIIQDNAVHAWLCFSAFNNFSKAILASSSITIKTLLEFSAFCFPTFTLAFFFKLFLWTTVLCAVYFGYSCCALLWVYSEKDTNNPSPQCSQAKIADFKNNNNHVKQQKSAF